MTRNKIHHAKTMVASGIVIHKRCTTNQLPETARTPVRMIVQGWHHQGFSAQRSSSELSDTEFSQVLLGEGTVHKWFIAMASLRLATHPAQGLPLQRTCGWIPVLTTLFSRPPKHSRYKRNKSPRVNHAVFWNLLHLPCTAVCIDHPLFS